MPRTQYPQGADPPYDYDPVLFSGETWRSSPESIRDDRDPVTKFLEFWKNGLYSDLNAAKAPQNFTQLSNYFPDAATSMAGDPRLIERAGGELARKVNPLGLPKDSGKIMRDLQRQIDEMAGKTENYEWDSKKKTMRKATTNEMGKKGLERAMQGAPNYSMIWSILGPLVKQYQIQRLRETGGA